MKEEKLCKEILDKLNYVRGHPHTIMLLKGEDKSEVEVRRGNWGLDDDVSEHVFAIEISELTYDQAKMLLSKLGKLRLDEEMYKPKEREQGCSFAQGMEKTKMNSWKEFLEQEKVRQPLRYEVNVLNIELSYLYFLWKNGDETVKEKLQETSAKLDEKLIALLEK